MKKQILNVGQVLTKSELKQVNGGNYWDCDPKYTQAQCDDYCDSLETVRIYAAQQLLLNDTPENDANYLNANIGIQTHCKGNWRYNQGNSLQP